MTLPNEGVQTTISEHLVESLMSVLPVSSPNEMSSQRPLSLGRDTAVTSYVGIGQPIHTSSNMIWSGHAHPNPLARFTGPQEPNVTFADTTRTTNVRGPSNDPTLPTLPTHQPVSVSNSPCVSFSSGIPQTPVSQGSGYFGRRKPATYDGSSSWKDHLVRFELVADLNRWPENIKALELAASLRGVAQGVLSDLPADQRKHYTSLVNRLTARFEPENQSDIYRARLKTRIRKKDEDLGTLAQEISRLVRKAYPLVSIEMQDRFALDAFIDALNDSDMEWAVHQGHPVSLQDASKVAHEYEAFRTGRGRKNILVRGRIQGIQKENPVFTPKRKTGPQHPLRRKQHEKSQWRGKCYFCQKEGHWIHECRGMQKAIPDPKWRENLMSLIKSSKTQPPDKKGNIAGCTPSYDDGCSLGQDKGTSIKSVDHGMSSIAGKVGGTIAQSDLIETVPTPVSSSESLYVPIMINGILVNGLVDSGATLTILHPEMYRQLPTDNCPPISGER